MEDAITDRRVLRAAVEMCLRQQGQPRDENLVKRCIEALSAEGVLVSDMYRIVEQTYNPRSV